MKTLALCTALGIGIAFLSVGSYEHNAPFVILGTLLCAAGLVEMWIWGDDIENRKDRK